MMSKTPAARFAVYFLCHGESKAKTQELLYHIQGAAIAYNIMPLFDDAIERGDSGHVIRDVADRWDSLAAERPASDNQFSQFERALMDFALRYFEKYNVADMSREFLEESAEGCQEKTAIDMNKYSASESNYKFAMEFSRYLNDNPTDLMKLFDSVTHE